MITGWSSLTFIEVKNRLKCALEWLEEAEIRVEHSRINAYHQSIKVLEHAYRTQRLAEIDDKETVKSLLNAFCEASEICHIHKHLSTLGNSNLKAKLKQLVGGPISYPDENPSASSNTARNIGFELCIAADLCSTGFVVDFGSNADVSFNTDQCRMHIECKRPQNSRSVKSNIKRAIKQLERRYILHNSKEEVRGIVAVSISKLVNETQEGLILEKPDDLDAILVSMIEKFGKNHMEVCRNRKEKRTIGMLVDLRIPFFVKQDNSVGMSHFFALFSFAETNNDRNILLNISEKLGGETFRRRIIQKT